MRMLTIVCAALLAAACDQVSNPSVPTPTIAGSVITLSSLPAAFDAAGSTVRISARVRNDRGDNATIGTPVTFTSSAGSLSATTAAVDSTGFATVSLTSREATYVVAQTNAGAGAMTVPVRAVTPPSPTPPPAPQPGLAVAVQRLSNNEAVVSVEGLQPPTMRFVYDFGDGTVIRIADPFTPVHAWPTEQGKTYRIIVQRLSPDGTVNAEQTAFFTVR